MNAFNNIDMKLWSNILCLDLGTKTGWSMSSSTESGLEFEWGIQDFSTRRCDGAGMRYLKFRDWLHHMYDKFEPIHEIYFEEVSFSGWRNSASTYGGFLSTLTIWCENHQIPYQGVPVSTIKKYITGKGNADKKMVIEAVRNKGYNVQDDNEADAMALSLYTRRI